MRQRLNRIANAAGILRLGLMKTQEKSQDISDWYQGIPDVLRRKVPLWLDVAGLNPSTRTGLTSDKWGNAL
jgi:hypothetical protein